MIMVRKNIPVNENSKDLETVGGRIYSERTRLKKTLVDFAILCGVTKQTQIKYEGNQNFPDTRYLNGAMRLGADVMYILTGYRSHDALPVVHQNLIEAFEAAPENLRQAAFAVLLSPYNTVSLKQPIEIPGYFQHEVLGEQDVRFRDYCEATHGAPTEAAGNSASPLSPDEAALLDNYRNSTPENQETLRKTGAALEKQEPDDGAQCA